MHHTVEALSMDSTDIALTLLIDVMVKLCSYNPTSNCNIYLWNGVLLFEQPLQNHHARL